MTAHEIDIQGMSCNHCVKTVDEALRHVPGVTRVEVKIGHAHVETETSVTREALVRALADADYVAS